MAGCNDTGDAPRQRADPKSRTVEVCSAGPLCLLVLLAPWPISCAEAPPRAPCPQASFGVQPLRGLAGQEETRVILPQPSPLPAGRQQVDWWPGLRRPQLLLLWLQAEVSLAGAPPRPAPCPSAFSGQGFPHSLCCPWWSPCPPSMVPPIQAPQSATQGCPLFPAGSPLSLRSLVMTTENNIN